LDVFKSRMGTAIHSAIENAWSNNYVQALKSLGYQDEIIERVVINPDPDSVTPDQIPVYMEQRITRKVGAYTVTGKFDFVAEGRLEDFKTTTAWSYGKDNKFDAYQIQGSVYRFLNPKIITQDVMAIQEIYTDWSKGMVGPNNYPSQPFHEKLIPLLSLEDTEQFMTQRLHQYHLMKSAPETQLPLCSETDLWRGETKVKYYADPNKLKRATKVFDSVAEAAAEQAKRGKGVIVEIPGDVKRCHFCPAFPVCTQKDALIADGSLIV